MQDKTYSALFDLIKALAGVDNFTTAEQSKILSFVNRRAKKAYETSDVWPRYFKAGEQRTLSTSPAQTVPYTEASKDNIGRFLLIHKTQPFVNLGATRFEFYEDADGAHIMGLSTSDATSVFVTYKKELNDFTTDSTDIPGEFFQYMAHAAYSDFLRMDRQHQKAVIEESMAIEYINDELENPGVLKNNQLISTISTHTNRQAR